MINKMIAGLPRYNRYNLKKDKALDKQQEPKAQPDTKIYRIIDLLPAGEIKKDNNPEDELAGIPADCSKSNTIFQEGNISKDNELLETRYKAKPNTNSNYVYSSVKEKFAQLQQIVEQTDDLVSVTNKDGLFEYVNPAFEKFTGYSRNEAIGKKSSLLKSGKHDQTFYEDLWKTVNSGKAFFGEFYNKKKSGEIYIEAKTINPIRDENGDISYFVSTGKDITKWKENEIQLLKYKDHLEELVEKRTEEYKAVQTELMHEVSWRKEAEEELRIKEERLQLAVEASEVGLWDLNLVTNKIYSNKIFQDLLGLIKTDEEGLSFDSFIDSIYEKDRKKFLNEYERHLKNITPVFNVEHRIRKSNGDIKWVVTKGKVAARDKDANPLRFLGKVEDISLRKQSELLIRKAFLKAKELADIKSRFVSMVSHEFRTPLATILSSAEVIEFYFSQLSENERYNHFRKIDKSIEYLSSLLNDIVTINKGDLNKIPVNSEDFELIEYCRQLIAETKLNNPNSNIKFISDAGSIPVKSDKKILRQIIINLLNNAVKYSRSGDEILFEIIYCDEFVEMKFTDKGIGIMSGDQDKLFEPFFRGSNAGATPGTGLGLSIVKRSIELLKGEIALNSKINSGTTFTVKIPQANNSQKSESI